MRHARVFGIALALGLALACTGVDGPSDSEPGEVEQQPPASPVTPPPGAWVRVSQWRLFWAANEDARIDVHPEHSFRFAEVVAVEGEFVELRSLPVEPGNLCATSSQTGPFFELRFFAKLDELTRVLSKPKVVRFHDGTKLEFAAGVPIHESSSGPGLLVGDDIFVVPLGPDEIGRWFPAVPKQARVDSSYTWSRARPLHYGERSFEPRSPYFVDVMARRAIGDDTLLTFANACGRFTLRVENEQPQMTSEPGILGFMERTSYPNLDFEMLSLIKCHTPWVAPAGVELTWDGFRTVAGVTRRGGELPEPLRRLSEDEVCIAVDDLPVCMARSELWQKEDPNCQEGFYRIRPNRGQRQGAE